MLHMKTTTTSEARVELKYRGSFMQPSISVRARQSTHRQLMAVLYRIAADVELATPPNEGWTVQIDAGRVYLELATNNDDEANRGIAILRKVVG